MPNPVKDLLEVYEDIVEVLLVYCDHLADRKAGDCLAGCKAGQCAVTVLLTVKQVSVQ